VKISTMAAVLIVDDEALIRWFVAESLETVGHQVLEAGSAREALRYFDDGGKAVSVVVLDLKLPDSSDLSLLRRIQALAPRCRIILMTAHGTPDVLDEALRAGAFAVLPKPFDVTKVQGLVRDALAAA
jgi:DNA-binding NtrC family response regulator